MPHPTSLLQRSSAWALGLSRPFTDEETEVKRRMCQTLRFPSWQTAHTGAPGLSAFTLNLCGFS